MTFQPFDVTTPHIIYACLGGFIVLFGMFSLFLRERLYIGEACWAFIFGIIIGPYCLDIFDPRAWGNGSIDANNMITLEFTRVVLAIGVFAIGVELPKAYMARHWKSLFFLLVPVMTWGWFISAALIHLLIPGLNFLSSLAVAACLTPTDPILAAAVVGGKWADKHVPAHIRHLLAAESGCNDGAAFPFLFIALYLTLDKSTGAAIRDWFLVLWLYQIALGALLGALLGFSFRHLMKFCQRHDLIDRHSYVAQYVSLAMLTIGITTLLGSDDLLAAFFCGTAFAWDGFFNRQTEESVFSSVIDTLFNVAAFIFVGAWMPFNKFQGALTVWRLLVVAVGVLVLRRIPVMMACYRWMPDIKNFRESVFCGHFGPIGIGGIFISTLATQMIRDTTSESGPHTSPQITLLEESIQPIVAFMVLCSIAVHGLSIPSFSLGRRVHSVSRTWSRHASMPDWTNQARVVTAPEDIVINRDRDDLFNRGADLERGLGGEKERSDASTEVAVDLEKEKEGSSDDGTRLGQSQELEAYRKEGDEDDYRNEVPPDGADTVMEWKEGKQRVVERKKGAGDDVEVEVIDDPDVPDGGAGMLKGAGEVIARDWQHLAHRAKGAVDSRHSTAVDPSRGSAVDSSRGSAVVDPSRQPTDPSRHSTAEPVFHEGSDEEDEGWSSEGSSVGGDGQVERHTSTSADNGHGHREGSPSSPGGSPSSPGGDSSTSTHPHGRKKPRIFAIHTARRRGSVHRRNSAGQAQSVPFTHGHGVGPAAPAIAEEPRGRQAPANTDESRGRQLPSIMQKTGHGHGHGHGRGSSRPTTGTSRLSGAPSRPSTAPSTSRPSTATNTIVGSRSSRPGTADSSLRNQRIDTIRALHSRPPTREASPSRSVRFVDDEAGTVSRGGSVANLRGLVERRGVEDVELGLGGEGAG